MKVPKDLIKAFLNNSLLNKEDLFFLATDINFEGELLPHKKENKFSLLLKISVKDSLIMNYSQKNRTIEIFQKLTPSEEDKRNLIFTWEFTR